MAKRFGQAAVSNTPLTDNFKIPYVYTLVDADGNAVPLAPGETVGVVSADEASATIVPDAVPTAGAASGWVLGGAKLQVGVGVTFTVLDSTGAPVTDVTPVVDLFDIGAGAPKTGSVQLGTPVIQ